MSRVEAVGATGLGVVDLLGGVGGDRVSHTQGGPASLLQMTSAF